MMRKQIPGTFWDGADWVMDETHTECVDWPLLVLLLQYFLSAEASRAGIKGRVL